MRTLAIDIETYSSIDLKKAGLYRYVQAPDFAILLFAYSVDGGPVEVVDMASFVNLEDYERYDLSPDHALPTEITEAIMSADVIKTAWNAAFERTCIAKYFGIECPPEQWECTMARAAHLGLPLSLDAAARVLGVAAKGEGKPLIKYFSQPCKPTKVNGQRTRNLPEHAPEKWAEFVEYCRQDVVVEQAIRAKVDFFKQPDWERQLWCLDQRINDRGVLVDPVLVESAIRIDEAYRAQLTTEAVELTGLQNPNSAAQLKAWLGAELESEVLTLKKTDIPDLLEQASTVEVERVLALRQELSKSSIKKYQAMRNALCDDQRIRGLLQYYGANRTGRWAGRQVQVQNLTKNSEALFGDKMASLDLARDLVRQGNIEMLDILFGSVAEVLSQLIRTAFIAPNGKKLRIADFSAIEARVIAWAAQEHWRLVVFGTHGKIYEASASQMFKVPLESVTKSSPYRQKGKVAELALGYQGGPGAIRSMEISNKTPKDKMIPEEELQPLVNAWRAANPKIVQLWYRMQDAAVKCVDTGEPVSVRFVGTAGVTFSMHKGTLFCELPSGRKLSYLRARLRDGKFGPEVCYEGMDQVKKTWGRISTYGGKLVENIVQAIARDCLAYALLALDAAGHEIVIHVHDEVVIEDDGTGSLEAIDRIMGAAIPWAPGLPLTADSYETTYYKKD